MKYSFSFLAAAAAVLASPVPQAVTSAIAPSGTVPAGCSSTYSGSFAIVAITQAPQAAKRQVISQISDGQIQAPTSTAALATASPHSSSAAAVAATSSGAAGVGATSSPHSSSAAAVAATSSPHSSSAAAGTSPAHATPVAGSATAPVSRAGTAAAGTAAAGTAPTGSKPSSAAAVAGSGSPASAAAIGATTTMVAVSQIHDGQIQAPRLTSAVPATAAATAVGSPAPYASGAAPIAPVPSASRAAVPVPSGASTPSSAAAVPAPASPQSHSSSAAVPVQSGASTPSSAAAVPAPASPQSHSSSAAVPVQSGASTPSSAAAVPVPASPQSPSSSAAPAAPTSSRSPVATAPVGTKGSSSAAGTALRTTVSVFPTAARPTGTAISHLTDGQPQAPTSAAAIPTPSNIAACSTNSTLTLTLADGVLKDARGWTGYIASNYQFQFDDPPQSGAIYTAGFSLCGSNLALGGSTTWYECLSGDFYNLYSENIAPQCTPITLNVAQLTTC